MPKGGGVGHLASAPAGRAEGMPTEAGHIQHLSSRPIQLSLGAMLFLLGAAFYPDMIGLGTMVVGGLLVAYSLFGWARDDYSDRFHVPPEGEGDRWPFAAIPKMKLGVWVFLSSEIVLFGSFLGAYIFMRAALPGWPSPATIHDVPLGTLNTIVLVSSGLTMMLAIQAIRSGDQRKLLMWLGTTFLLGSTFMGIKLSEWTNLTSAGFLLSSANPVMAIVGSSYYVIVGLHAAHVTAGLIVMIYLMRKTLGGRYTAGSHEAIENFGLYWAFVDIVWCFVFPLFYLI